VPPTQEPEPTLVHQSDILRGNMLYEWSQMLAAGGGEWRPVLDEAVSLFRGANCKEEDIRNALKNHSQVGGVWPGREGAGGVGVAGVLIETWEGEGVERKEEDSRNALENHSQVGAGVLWECIWKRRGMGWAGGLMLSRRQDPMPCVWKQPARALFLLVHVLWLGCFSVPGPVVCGVGV